MSLVLYAGPTLQRALGMHGALPLDDVEVLPPVQRGDVPRLRATRRPGVMAIVDGLFHEALSVGHAEIREALAAGWQIWGLSSMGAIRAREMSRLGMRGFGEVYALYCRADVDFRDDEVTLLHAPDPPYRELSEPLVHLRLGLEALPLAAELRSAVVGELESLWYGERTFAWLEERLRGHVEPEQWQAWLASFDRFRIKAHDLARFLRERPWRDATLTPG